MYVNKNDSKNINIKNKKIYFKQNQTNTQKNSLTTKNNKKKYFQQNRTNVQKTNSKHKNQKNNMQKWPLIQKKV